MAEKKSGVTPATAGVAGALVGAVVGAAAVAMSDKKTRKQVLEKLNELKSQAGEQFSDIRGDLQSWLEENAEGMMPGNGKSQKKQLPAGKKKTAPKAKKTES